MSTNTGTSVTTDTHRTMDVHSSIHACTKKQSNPRNNASVGSNMDMREKNMGTYPTLPWMQMWQLRRYLVLP